MTARLIVPPTGLALALAEARTAARVDVGEDGTSPLDAEIEAAIRTYTSEAESETNRAIIEQTWRLMLDDFPSAIQLSMPRLIVVEHVKFYGPDGEQYAIDPRDYLGDSESEPAYVIPAPGRAWPATARRVNAVEVQYRCGYGPDHTSVPDSIKGFIRARIAEHFNTGKHAENGNVTRLLWREVVHVC